MLRIVTFVLIIIISKTALLPACVHILDDKCTEIHDVAHYKRRKCEI
jgi:hypothetical protein